MTETGWTVQVTGELTEQSCGDVCKHLIELDETWHQINAPTLNLIQNLQAHLEVRGERPVLELVNDILTDDEFPPYVSDHYITVLICSPGGHFNAAVGVVDVLRQLSAPVKVVSTGLCASAAALILGAGPKGTRMATPHTRFLLHELQIAYQGSANGQFDSFAADIKAQREMALEMLLEFTDASERQLKEALGKDMWLGAHEALELGLIDHIVGETEEAD